MGPEAEFEEFNKNNSWAHVYETIKTKSSLLEYTSLDARRPENRNRNRYRDVSPYDHSRVPLQREGIDYINANIVEAPYADRSYILTQGPLPNTCGHFWLMVWEQNSKAVLMLNRTVERGRGPLEETCGHFWLLVWEQRSKAVLMLNNCIEKGSKKCHEYFPMKEDEGDEVLEFEDVGLSVTFLDETNYRYFTVRTFRLQDLTTDESKEVLQFHYTTWPDFKVPTLSAFLNYLNAVRQSGALGRDVGPPVIHCSAGIGRSGTFCLVDTCLVLIEKQGTMENINVQQVLMDMRQYRMGLIQTAEQLQFSYEAIIEGGKRILSASPDSGFSDSNDVTEPEPLVTPLTSSNHALPTQTTSEQDDSDADVPPPLPPRRKPPPPPSSPPPDDDDEEEDEDEEEVDVETGDVCTDNGVQGRASRDELEEMKDLLRGLGNSADHTPEAQEVTEDERRQGVELRRRNRDERRKATQDQIQRMKQRQGESEKWREKKSSISPVLIGIGVTGVVGLVLLYRYYFS